MTTIKDDNKIELPNFFEFCNSINFDTDTGVVANSDGTLTIKNDFININYKAMLPFVIQTYILEVERRKSSVATLKSSKKGNSKRLK